MSKTIRSRKAPTKPKPMSDRERLSQLKEFVKLCLWVLQDDFQNIHQLAEATGLCDHTIKRYIQGEVSLRCWIGSLQKLANAAGFSLTLSETDVDFKIIRRKFAGKTPRRRRAA